MAKGSDSVFSFPRQEFPRFSPPPVREGEYGQLWGLGSVSLNNPQQFNTVDYSKFSAMLAGEKGELYFRQMGRAVVATGRVGAVESLLLQFSVSGRDRHVQYKTPSLPLCPPNTRMLCC